MQFIEKIRKITNNKNTIIFTDMDGVIADYEFGNPLNFKTKRPLKNNINIFRELIKYENIKLKILSICRSEINIAEKNQWLDKHAPFFAQEDRYILAKEKIELKHSKEIKCRFLKQMIEVNPNTLIILIDDDNDILKYLDKNIGEKIILFQDSSIVD